MKLTVVGGGSTYTPELIDGIANLRAQLDVDEVALVDPDAERLSVVGAFAQRQLQHAGHPAVVRTSTELEPGVDGASVVLFQLRVGGQEARRSDETFPGLCGCVGQETTGAGGFAKALRTVPVVLDVADRVRKLAGEDTWIVNFTNPVGIVTRALLQAGHRAVGLCNVAITMQRWIAGHLDIAPDRVELDHIGLNHLTWERSVRVDGAEVLPKLLSEYGDQLTERLGMPVELMRRLEAIPSGYLRYYYAHDEVVAEQREKPPRADAVRATETELLRQYADPKVVSKPEQLSERGGAYYSEAAIRLVRSLVSEGAEEHVVNVRNGGTLPFLPDDAVIETRAHVDSGGVKPLPAAPLGPLHSGLVSQVTSYEFLALEAALRGGRDRVIDALLAHPLVAQYDRAVRLADELIARNTHLLPWQAV